MSAGCVRFVLNQAVRTVCGGGPVCWTPASRFTICCERFNITAASWRWSPFSTEVQDAEQTPEPKKKKGPRAHNSISSVGRKIAHRQLQVISEAGENLGTLHRGDVIRMMDEKGLKLVLLNENKDPPVYQLMNGKQIYEEQLKRREKQTAKAASVQVKELAFSHGIGPQDLSTKLKQVESWLEKKHHVKITLQAAHKAPAVNMDTALEQMVEQMGIMVGFVSPPKVIRNGRAATCIIRLLSAKELSRQKQNKASESPSVSSTSKASQSETPPVTSTDTAEGSAQQ
ncbi:translation initiation factor IF-3, mitochondrial [Stegastes partitus]|uniref:Mitochondrial translational initiation factor 3 n=1 Tax=Stegastes partitus TaxID=144197 RepID=A0A3B5AX03_9TELE|nr:PREDICTED: translation initiation factor IF-3, mitochondrial [Stegastes partitus]